MEQTSLYTRYAAAYVRGEAIRARAAVDGQTGGAALALPALLLEKDLDALSGAELDVILNAGRDAGLKLYRFKTTHEELPRVRRVLGYLKSVPMERLLDVGSGRGVFLWPCLNAFPWLEVLSVDLLPQRVDLIRSVRLGGVGNLDALQADIRALDGTEGSFDVVTMLEVLEHIPDPLPAVRSAVRLAKRAVVVTVPSKPDDNPEHIHLFTRERLAELFRQAGCSRVHFDEVRGHLFLAAILEG